MSSFTLTTTGINNTTVSSIVTNINNSTYIFADCIGYTSVAKYDAVYLGNVLDSLIDRPTGLVSFIEGFLKHSEESLVKDAFVLYCNDNFEKSEILVECFIHLNRNHYFSATNLANLNLLKIPRLFLEDKCIMRDVLSDESTAFRCTGVTIAELCYLRELTKGTKWYTLLHMCFFDRLCDSSDDIQIDIDFITENIHDVYSLDGISYILVHCLDLVRNDPAILLFCFNIVLDKY